VFKHLLMCMETPRPSHDLDRIRGKISAFAKSANLEYTEDEAGNCVVRKPASKGCENAVGVVIQSHLDMVTSKAADKQHDWAKDPIEPIIDGEYLKADRTTLGADDGIGVAAALALLEDNTLVHGPLECLFTADEETTMGGAEFLAGAPFLTGKVLINVDSEEDHQVCMGCAGGFEKKLYLPLSPVQEEAGEEYTSVVLDVSRLFGGHTGINIADQRANALLCMARVLDAFIRAAPSTSLCYIKGGNAPNAIPRDAVAVVSVKKDELSAASTAAEQMWADLRVEFASTDCKGDSKGEEKEPGMKLKIAANQDECNVLLSSYSSFPRHSPSSTRQAVDLMLNAPHGVIRMSKEDVGAVDTSISFSIVEFPAKDEGAESGKMCLHWFCRSTSDYQMKMVENRLEGLARLSGASFSGSLNYFPGWEPNAKSLGLKAVVAAHKKLFNLDPRVYSVHAGLECGWIQKRYPEMQCVSVGPLIHDAHTPDEALKIDTVAPFYDWLKESLVYLSQEKA